MTERLIAMLSAGFGLLATLLAAIGLYGVIWLVMREVLLLLAVGLAIGVPAAMALGRYVASQLYGIQPQDPAMAIGTVLLLALVSAVAGFIPAHCASRIDPILALRHE